MSRASHKTSRLRALVFCSPSRKAVPATSEANSKPSHDRASATSTTQRTVVDGSVSGGSGGVNSPLSAESLPSGASTGDYIALEVIDDNADGQIDKWYYGHENQRGDRTGMTNAAGNRVAETDFSKHGDVYHKHILWDIDSADTTGSREIDPETLRVFFPTTIPLASNDVMGAVLRGIDSGVHVGNIFDRGIANVFEDPEHADQPYIDIITDDAAALELAIINGFTVFEQYDTSLRQQALGTTASGTFGSVSYNAGADETTLTHTGHIFTGMEGFDAKIFVTQGGFQIRWLEILSVPNADQIVVAGDQTPSSGNVIYSIYAPAGIHSGGIWTAEDSDGVVTKLTTTRSFPAYAVGWSVQIDATIPAYYEVLSVGGNIVVLDGDLTSLVTPDVTQFSLITPSGVNSETGATQTDPCVPESRYYWGGGYYLPPIVGFEMLHDGVFGIHGAQPGPASGATPNLAGQHYMHNRIYDINTGRWTTPDPAASPYWNLQDYVGGNPISRRDPSGLKGCSLTIYTKQLAGASMEEHDLAILGECPSKSGSDFVNCIRSKLASDDCNCISNLLIVGHGSSALGRGDSVTTLSQDDKDYLRSAMCSGAKVENRKCDSEKTFREMAILTILLGGDDHMSESGQGWVGCCNPVGWPNSPGATKRNWWVPPDAGTSKDELRRVHLLNREADKCWNEFRKERNLAGSKYHEAVEPFVYIDFTGGFYLSGYEKAERVAAEVYKRRFAEIKNNRKKCMSKVWDKYYGRR